jgi:dipeptidyl aminopeptidase/acylaminoacyl peptidase
MALPDGKSVLVFSYQQPRGNKLAMVRVTDGKVTEFDGEAENPIGVAGGYLLFGRVDGTLGVAPFDPARTRSVEALIPVLDAPLHRNSGLEATLSSAGDLVYVKAAGSSRMMFLDMQGHIIGVSPDDRNLRDPRISPDGRQVVVRELTENRRGDLWLYDVTSGVRRPLTTGIVATAPAWTPDGHRVLYTFDPDASVEGIVGRGGPAQTWSVPADRSGPAERLIAMPIPIARTVLSPDSRYAIVTAIDPTTHKDDLYLVDLKGDHKPQPLERSSFDEAGPAVSPDGRWLAYVSNESGHNEVYVRPFPATGPHVQVSADGGSDPRWEKGSHGIVYRNGDRFMKARLAIGASIAVAERGVLFTGPYTDYDLSQDGTIVALQPGSAGAEIIVVTNWLSELKAKRAKK